MSFTRHKKVTFGVILLLACVAQAWDFVSQDALDAALERPPVLIALIKDVADQKTRNLEVEWSALAETQDVPKLAHECRSGSKFCDDIESSQFPRVVFFIGKDDSHVYRGQRAAPEIDLFVRRMQNPVVAPVSASDSESFKMAHDGVCLCIASPGKHEQFISAFNSVASKYRSEFSFGLLQKNEQKDSVPSVECSRQTGSKQEVYSKETKGLEAFMLEALRPIITDLTPYNHQRLLNRQWPMVYIFVSNPSERISLRRDLHDFASSYPDLGIVLVDPLDFPDLLAKLGLEDKQKQVRYPAIAVHQLTTGKIWPYPRGKALDKSSLQQWGMDVWQGKIRPWNQPGNEGGAKGGKKKQKQGQKNVKSHRQIKLPNVPGLEKLRKKLEGRDEL